MLILYHAFRIKCSCFQVYLLRIILAWYEKECGRKRRIYPPSLWEHVQKSMPSWFTCLCAVLPIDWLPKYSEDYHSSSSSLTKVCCGLQCQTWNNLGDMHKLFHSTLCDGFAQVCEVEKRNMRRLRHRWPHMRCHIGLTNKNCKQHGTDSILSLCSHFHQICQSAVALLFPPGGSSFLPLLEFISLEFIRPEKGLK